MRRLTLILTALALSCSAAVAQTRLPEASRSLTGSLSVGWLDTSAHEVFSERRSNPFFTLGLDYRDSILDPGFLTYRVQPQFSAGFLNVFTGMSEGSGIAFDSTFLPRRPWPFRFHYSRFRRSLLTSGLGTSYSKFTTRNDDSNLGFQWSYSVPRQPSFEVTFSNVAVSAEPEALLNQGFDTRSKNLALSGRDSRWGWNTSGSASFQKLDNRYLVGSTAGPLALENKSDLRTFVLMSQKSLASNLDFLMTATRNVNRTDFDRGVFDQQYDSASGKLDYRPTGRLQAWALARVTHSDLESAVSTAARPVPVAVASTNLRTGIADGEVRLRVLPALSIIGRTEQTWTDSTDQNGISRQDRNFNTVGGVQYIRPGDRLSLAASYYVNSLRSKAAGDALADSLGHSGDASVTVAVPRVLRLGVNASVNRTREDVFIFLPYHSRSERYGVSLLRRFFGRCDLEVQGSIMKSWFTRQRQRSDFRSRDFGVRLDGRSWQLSYNRTRGTGDSIQSLTDGGPIGIVGPAIPLFFASSSSSSTESASAAWTPLRPFQLRAVWRNQRQTIGPVLASSYEQREAVFSWQYRRLRFEAAYLLYRYDFGSPTFRESIVGRITREFQVF